MNQQESETKPKNAVWQVVNDEAEMDDLLNLALRDLKRKFDQGFETKFERILSWSGDYPEMEVDENERTR